jgi:hypothetical protein
MLNAFVREGAAEGEAIGIGRFSYPKQAFGKLQELSKKHNYLYQYLTDVSEGTPLAEKPADLLGEARRFTEAVGTAQKVKLGEANFLTSEMAWPKGRGTIPLVAESPLIQRLSTRAGELGRIISKLGAETTYDDVVGAVSKNTGFMSILDDIGQKAYSSGVISAQMGLPIAAAALILGVGAAKMISDRREDEAWRMPSKLFGKYEQPGAVMMENRNSVAAEMSPPVPQKRRMDRQSIWDTSDIITILGLNRTRHYNMDSARNSFLYGGMAGRV